MIRFACPSCSSTFSVSDDKAGKSSNCPKCRAAFVIPGEAPTSPPPPKPVAPPPIPRPSSAPIAVDPCPKCGTKVSVEPTDLGTRVECPQCSMEFVARKPGTGSRPTAALREEPRRPEPRRRDEDEDDRPRNRRRREDDDEDDRPRRRRDEDDEEGRPRSRRRPDRDEEDYDRPRRRPRLRSGSNEGQGARVGSAVLGFIIGALSLLCGIAVIVAGAAVVDLLTGAGKAAASAPPPPAFNSRGFPTSPNINPNPNANAAAGAAVAGAGWIGGGVIIGCGVVAMLFAAMYIGGGIGLLQRRFYGKVLTIIAAVVSALCALLTVYGLISSLAAATVISILVNLLSLGVYSAHAVFSFMATFGRGSENFR